MAIDGIAAAPMSLAGPPRPAVPAARADTGLQPPRHAFPDSTRHRAAPTARVIEGELLVPQAQAAGTMFARERLVIEGRQSSATPPVSPAQFPAHALEQYRRNAQDLVDWPVGVSVDVSV